MAKGVAVTRAKARPRPSSSATCLQLPSSTRDTASSSSSTTFAGPGWISSPAASMPISSASSSATSAGRISSAAASVPTTSSCITCSQQLGILPLACHVCWPDLIAATGVTDAKRNSSIAHASHEPSASCPEVVQEPTQQTLQDFVDKHPLVHPVPLTWKGNTVSIVDTTHDGRLLLRGIIAAISKAHSENFTWGGKFGKEDILVINSKEVVIKKKPVKFTTTNSQVPRREDLRQAADILEPLYYNEAGVSPAYFDELIKDLKAPRLSARNEWFTDQYLPYHLAMIRSRVRKTFEMDLYSSVEYLRPGRQGNLNSIPILKHKPAVYANGWRTIVKSAAKEDGITVLEHVYDNSNYEETTWGLIRYKRNFFQHGAEEENVNDMDELELYSAKKFSQYLPFLLQTLFSKGHMKSGLLRKPWLDLMESSR